MSKKKTYEQASFDFQVTYGKERLRPERLSLPCGHQRDTDSDPLDFRHIELLKDARMRKVRHAVCRV